MRTRLLINEIKFWRWIWSQFPQRTSVLCFTYVLLLCYSTIQHGLRCPEFPLYEDILAQAARGCSLFPVARVTACFRHGASSGGSRSNSMVRCYLGRNFMGTSQVHMDREATTWSGATWAGSPRASPSWQVGYTWPVTPVLHMSSPQPMQPMQYGPGISYVSEAVNSSEAGNWHTSGSHKRGPPLSLEAQRQRSGWVPEQGGHQLREQKEDEYFVT